ncbi:MAG: TolC family protein [Bacillota bacterium]
MRPFIWALGLLACAGAQASPYANLLDKAWLRLPQAQSQPAREAELDASRAAASSVFPSPPALELAHRTDRFNDNAGAREIEAALAMPLWLPGERDARKELAASEAQRYSAEQLALRLQLAGELREAIWQVKLAENARTLALGRLASARQTEADVARRVKAGDLARSDLLLAQGETMAAQAAIADAERELAGARQAYTRIVGDEVLPAVEAEQAETTAAGGDIETHPALALQRRRVAAAQARQRLVTQTRRDNPELSVGTRRERATPDERYTNTVTVALRLPFGTESRNAPRMAAAQAELTEAEAEYRRQRFDIEQGIRKALLDVDIARHQAELAATRHALAQDNLQLVKKAFSLGEKSLFEFQRAQALANEAELAANQADITLNRAYARLNQAKGLLP